MTHREEQERQHRETTRRTPSARASRGGADAWLAWLAARVALGGYRTASAYRTAARRNGELSCARQPRSDSSRSPFRAERACLIRRARATESRSGYDPSKRRAPERSPCVLRAPPSRALRAPARPGTQSCSERASTGKSLRARTAQPDADAPSQAKTADADYTQGNGLPHDDDEVRVLGGWPRRRTRALLGCVAARARIIYSSVRPAHCPDSEAQRRVDVCSRRRVAGHPGRRGVARRRL